MTSAVRRAAALCSVLAAALLACGTERPPPAGYGIFGDAGTGGSGGPPSILGSDPWTAVPACAQETQYVYVIDAEGKLRRFDPPSGTFTVMGKLACAGSPFSMAVDRTAVAWVVFVDGRLVRVDTRSGQCVPTAYAPGQPGVSSNFGMGFATNDATGGGETLFVASDMPERLAAIDTTSLLVRPIATFDAVQQRAELTGTGDGRLFAAFEGTPYVVAEIDKTNGHVKSQAPQEGVSAESRASNFAFAFWGGDFYLFVGPGTSTDVFRYRPEDGTTIKLSTESFVIVGAGVSTCAPIKGPR